MKKAISIVVSLCVVFSLAGFGLHEEGKSTDQVENFTSVSEKEIKAETAAEATTGEQSASVMDTVPNPNTYFGEPAAVCDDGETSWMFAYLFSDIDKETRSQKFIDFIYFVDVLQNDYGLQLSDKSIGEEDKYFRFYLDADDSLQRLPDYQQSCHVYLCGSLESGSEENSYGFDIIIIYSNDLKIEDFNQSENTQDDTAQEISKQVFSSEQESGSIQSIDPNSAVLPDLGTFLQCNKGEDYSDVVSYSFDLDEGESIIDDVLLLLLEPEYQLSFSRSTERDYISVTGELFEDYYYDYTGDASVGQYEDVWDEVSNVKLTVAYYYSQGRIGVALYFGSGFTFVDPGKQLENPPTDFSGNPTAGSGSGVPDAPNHPRTDCSICRGSGDCQVCGGSGYLWSTASGKDDRNCWSCNTTGNCIYCGGTGKN